MSKHKTEVVSLVWDNLTESPSDKNEVYRTLPCGCIVFSDGDYLDVFIWTGEDRQCNAVSQHYLMQVLTRYAEDQEIDDEGCHEVRALIERITEGWAEQGDLLDKFDAIGPGDPEEVKA